MMQGQKLISVIIPTYNREPYIGQAITSVLNQTYEAIELIVIDDGSTDRTPDIVASFDDPRLHYIRLDKNIGRSAARNKGFEAARGEFITFLDSDDYYLPEKVAIQVDFLDKHPEYGMVYTASGCFKDEDGPIIYFYRAPVSGDIYADIAFFKPLTITLPTVMLRKEVLQKVGGFDESMSRFEDTDFWRRISRHFRIGAIDQVTCHIRSHDGNLIHAFAPASFKQAIDYYVAKVMSEDKDVDPMILGAGARRLHELYGEALLEVDGGRELSAKLLAEGRRHFQPLVSIIIPVYNGANYLRQAVDSALAQTYANIEVVIVDDGSTDGGATERIIQSYGDRVRAFSQPNGGCSAALNRAVRETRGDYISWLSHDDLMAPTKVEKQVALLAKQGNPTTCIVYGNYSVFEGDKPVFADTPAVAYPKVPPEHFRYFLTTQNILHGCSLLIPKRTIIEHGMFDEGLRTVLDFDLWFRLAKTNRFIFCPDVGIHARAHADQDSSRKRDLFMTEANDMLARFARELAPDEIKAASGSSLLKGYYLIADSFHRRNFASAGERTLNFAEARARELLASNPADADGQEALAFLLSLARRAVEKGDAPSLGGSPAEPALGAPVPFEGVASLASAGQEPAIAARSFQARLAVLVISRLRRYPLTGDVGLKIFYRLPERLQSKIVNAWRTR